MDEAHWHGQWILALKSLFSIGPWIVQSPSSFQLTQDALFQNQTDSRRTLSSPLFVICLVQYHSQRPLTWLALTNKAHCSSPWTTTMNHSPDHRAVSQPSTCHYKTSNSLETSWSLPTFPTSASKTAHLVRRSQSTWRSFLGQLLCLRRNTFPLEYFHLFYWSFHWLQVWLVFGFS